MDWVAISATSGAIVAAGTVSVFIFRHLHPRLVAFRQFWGHLVGIDANPVTGQEEVPGLFERLTAIEQRIEARLDQQDAVLAAQDQTLAIVKHEVQHNGGGSIKDAVKRIETRLDQHLKEPE